MTYNVFSGTLNLTHFTSLPQICCCQNIVRRPYEAMVLVITAISRCWLTAILFSIDKEAQLMGNFVPRSPAMSPNNRDRSTPIPAAVNTESKRSPLLGYKYRPA